MSSTIICCPTYGVLQKFYSAVKHVEAFCVSGDMFDNISSLDSFFSEFRNITFMAQKTFSNLNKIVLYENARDKFLISPSMRWFVDSRNKTTKQQPFALKKQIVFELYLHSGRLVLVDERFSSGFEEELAPVKEFISTFLIEKVGLIEVFFSARIVFSENGEHSEIYPLILSGMDNMMLFVNELSASEACLCKKCDALMKKIKDARVLIVAKEMTFKRDYSFEKGKVEPLSLVSHDVEQVSIDEHGNYIKLKDMRLSLNKSSTWRTWHELGTIKSLFFDFSIMHISIFRAQNHDIQPVFMVVYRDDTYSMIPYYPLNKATTYRTIHELEDSLDFAEVKAIFHCCEYYKFDKNKFDYANETPYSERIKNADGILLNFTCIEPNEAISELNLDVKFVDCDAYVSERLNAFSLITDRSVFYLNPLVDKMRDNS